MRGGRKLASRAALLLLAVFITIYITNQFFPSLNFRDSSSGTMSGQQALQTLKALTPVQQRRAAAILGALLADVASESVQGSLSCQCRLKLIIYQGMDDS